MLPRRINAKDRFYSLKKIYQKIVLETSTISTSFIKNLAIQIFNITMRKTLQNAVKNQFNVFCQASSTNVRELKFNFRIHETVD